jgi:hypothetical protein
VRRGRASYDGRPYADMVVFNDSGHWFIRFAGKALGPCSTSEEALKAAIKTARLAERQGKTARVQVQTGPAVFETVWPRAVKAQSAKTRKKPHKRAFLPSDFKGTAR